LNELEERRKFQQAVEDFRKALRNEKVCLDSAGNDGNNSETNILYKVGNKNFLILMISNILMKLALTQTIISH